LQRRDEGGVAEGGTRSDKGLASDWRRKQRDDRGALVIPPKVDREAAISCVFAMDRGRHRVANLFCDLQQPRKTATRCAKADQSLAATVMARK
jgi:hypothetical protein